MTIDLRTPLSLRTAFAFPVQNALARRELLFGAVVLLIPVVGWILNMGHRIQFVHNMQSGIPTWPAWRDLPRLFRLGTVAVLGMCEYYLPSFIVGSLAWWFEAVWLAFLAAVLGLAATIAIPGFMSHYCQRFDGREVLDPLRALRRVREGGWQYWKAWGIALAALAVSFLGLLAFGVGFLITSVWFWQVAGYCFAAVFSQRFDLVSSQNCTDRSRAGVS